MTTGSQFPCPSASTEAAAELQLPSPSRANRLKWISVNQCEAFPCPSPSSSVCACAHVYRSKKRYRSDESSATMFGDKLDNFTAVFKVDARESPPKAAFPVLDDIPDLEDGQQLAIYDVLVADDGKFKSLMALHQRMKKKWVLKQINT